MADGDGDRCEVHTDDDVPGFIVDTAGGVVVGETGAQDTFRVSLRTRPTAPVSLSVSASPAARVALSPATITLHAFNWSTGVTVDVTGLDDEPPVDDNDESVTVVLGVASSADPTYGDLAAPDVIVTVVDDDVASIVLSSMTARTLLETGPPLEVTTVSLATRPAGTVTVPVSSGSSVRASVSPSSLLFDASNWNVPVPVTMSAFDDDVRNGDLVFHVGFGPTSGDAAYAGATAGTVEVTVVDEERRIVLSNQLAPSTVDWGGVSWLLAADLGCSLQGAASYKALLIASTRLPNTATWVMKPGYNYVRGDGATVIARASARGELTDPPQNTTTGRDDVYWTGIQIAVVAGAYIWEPGNSCANWLSDNAGLNGVTGTGNVLSVAFAGIDRACDVPRPVLCVEQ
ncbi:MAG: DUF1554 domain-containing protein [Myxococcota bacterium]|nr:DUF1554 domain-containing protein [Myxococcota bacterium]